MNEIVDDKAVKAGGPGSGPRGNVKFDLSDEDNWNTFAPGTGAHDQSANSFSKSLPGGNLKDGQVEYHINPLQKRKGFSLTTAGHPASAGLWQDHGTFNTHKQAMKAAHNHYNGIEVKASEELISLEVVHCRASGNPIPQSKQWAQGESVEFMYMPAGVHTITAGFGDKAVNLTVKCDQSTVDAIQASFEEHRKTTPKRPPFGCIEHREEDASVLAKSFSWRDGEDAGVYVAAEPTARGVEHVNGKIHNAWSPSFMTDAAYNNAKETNGVLYFPDGVRGSASNPARITGIAFCVGTLTNKPAFKKIAPVKAKEGVVTAGSIKLPFSEANELSKKADSISRPAELASNRAEKSGKIEDHVTAYHLHSYAAEKHQEAYETHGDSPVGQIHEMNSDEHKRQASIHQDAMQKGLNKASNPRSSSEILSKVVRAGGSGSGSRNGIHPKHIDTIVARSDNGRPLHGREALDHAIEEAPKGTTHIYRHADSGDDGAVFTYAKGGMNGKEVADSASKFSEHSFKPEHTFLAHEFKPGKASDKSISSETILARLSQARRSPATQ